MALTRLGLNQAVNLATNTTGTLAVANGGTGLSSGFINGTTNVGKVLQVVNAEVDAGTTTTAGTLQDTSLFADITPSATSSKIFIQIQPQLLATSTNYESGLGFGISREIDSSNNTTVFETKYEYDGLYLGQNSGSSDHSQIRAYPYVAHLDSPNTTGVCRYKFRIKAYSATAKLNESSGRSRIYLFEVAA